MRHHSYNSFLYAWMLSHLFKFDGSKFQTFEPKYLNDLYPNVYVLNLGISKPVTLLVSVDQLIALQLTSKSIWFHELMKIFYENVDAY